MRRVHVDYTGLIVALMKTTVIFLSAVSAVLLAGVISVFVVFVIAQIPRTEKVDLSSSQPNRAANVGNTSGLPLKLPPGFAISIFAKDLQNPRVMASDNQGNILVSLTSEGKVIALPDKNRDGISDGPVTVLEKLNKPHGLAFKCKDSVCVLFVAESNKVVAYDYDSKNLIAQNGQKIADLPDLGGHFTRSIMFLPGSDSELLVSVGSSCNVCNESDWRRAKILKINIATGQMEEYATGLRNSVFMTVSDKQEVWATEMGRDLLGDNIPPDEINIIGAGKNYGWPACYGKKIQDPFGKGADCSHTEPSLIDLQAHSAPLGLAFIPERGWPSEYGGDLLVAYHGSWNRTTPTGYKIVRQDFDEDGKYVGEEDFISGWLTENNKVLGRPAGLLVQPASPAGGPANSSFISDLYISDDQAGAVYRVTYKSGQAWRFFESHN